MFWILQLRKVKLTFSLSNVYAAMLLCVPSICPAEAIEGFLAPLFLYQGISSGDLEISEALLGPGCHRDGLIMPFRLAVNADQHAEFQHILDVGPDAARELRRTWLIHFPEDGDGARTPTIFTAMDQLPMVSHMRSGQAAVSKADKVTEVLKGTAVLFAGSWRFEESVVVSIQRHLVLPLQAKVFAVFSHNRQRRGWVERRALKKIMPALAAFSWVLDDPTADLRRKIRPSALAPRS